MSSRPNDRLRERTGAEGPLLVVGAPNALTARLCEDLGFEAVYATGAGIANTFLGAPDIGLLTLPELAAHVAAIRDAVELPLIVDADTGFGNSLTVGRTVRMLERAGANAIQIEDQVSPKRCGHFSGKEVISVGEMVGKVHAAVDARIDDSLVVVARTDALAVHGLDAACERANRYREAGADVVFVEAPVSREELAEVPRRVPGPLVANMVEGGLTPVLPLDELAGMGYQWVLYANTAMRAAVASMRQVLRHLRDRGDTIGVSEQVISWRERQDLVRKPLFDALEEKYVAYEEDIGE